MWALCFPMLNLIKTILHHCTVIYKLVLLSKNNEKATMFVKGFKCQVVVLVK